jgi:hypothetical protein
MNTHFVVEKPALDLSQRLGIRTLQLDGHDGINGRRAHDTVPVRASRVIWPFWRVPPLLPIELEVAQEIARRREEWKKSGHWPDFSDARNLLFAAPLEPIRVGDWNWFDA